MYNSITDHKTRKGKYNKITTPRTNSSIKFGFYNSKGESSPDRQSQSSSSGQMCQESNDEYKEINRKLKGLYLESSIKPKKKAEYEQQVPQKIIEVEPEPYLNNEYSEINTLLYELHKEYLENMRQRMAIE